MKTFKQLQEEVLRYFDLAGEATDNADGSDAEMAKAALNAANQQRSTEDNWKFMLSGVYTFTISAPTQSYVIPHTNFSKFQYFWSDTHKYFLSSLPIREVPGSSTDFDQSHTNSNLYYDFAGYSPVVTQPSTADTLELTSTVSETNNPTLYIEGENSSGLQISESLDVGGTTSQSFAKVTYVAKDGEFLGTITLATSGATTLLTLTIDEFGKQYPIIKFYNIPTENETFTYRFFRNPRVMVRDYDLPDIPFPACNVLVYDALLSEATYNELDSESVNIWREKQINWLNTLYMQKLEGDTVGGVGEYTHDGGQDVPLWR